MLVPGRPPTSGLNFHRPKFTRVIDEVVAGRVKTLVVAHKDRLARFGFDLLEHLCTTHGCTLLVITWKASALSKQ